MTEPLRTCKTCGLEAHTENDLSLFVSNKTGKHGRKNVCKACHAEKCSQYKQVNNERLKEYYKQYHLDNAEHRREYFRQYYQNNAEQRREYDKQRYQDNIERVREQHKEYAKANRDKMAAIKARYRAAKRNATPAWFDMEKKRIEFLYTTAQLKELHVDHIVPLQNDIVCGLHCLANLQLLTPSDNIAKSNSFAA